MNCEECLKDRNKEIKMKEEVKKSGETENKVYSCPVCNFAITEVSIVSPFADAYESAVFNLTITKEGE